MLKNILAYLKREKKDILLASICLVLVTVGYLAYLYLVGVPMTRAKNYYNLAYLAFQAKEYTKAQDAIENSLHYYTEPETLELQSKIQEALVKD